MTEPGIDALFARATAAHEAGNLQEAERGYRAVLGADAGHADALHQLGLLAYQNGHISVAVDLVDRALARAPDRGVYHNTLGGALLEAGRVEEAISSFERAARLMPTSIEARNNLASALNAGGRAAEALALYRKLVDEAPNDADVNNNFGRALEASGNLTDAIRYLRAARSLRPKDAMILTNLGLALCGQGLFDEAAEVCEQAVRLDPHSPAAQLNLGNARVGLERHEDAIVVYERVIALDPGFADAHKNLGIAYYAAGRLEAAARCLANVLTTDPSDPVRLSLARILASLGRTEDAVAHFRAVLETDPGDHETRLALGLALNDLGRHAEGLREIAGGPGLARLSMTGAGGKSVRRTPLGGSEPNFIGSWSLADPDLCDAIIAFFEANAGRHRQGRTIRGVDLEVKRATDLVIFPRELAAPDHAPVAAYLRELEACLQDYALQWPHLAATFPGVDLVPFQIQRYLPGGHFQSPHFERASFGLMHRVLAWMTYLNDVDDGGHTRFHSYGLDVKPERGKTLIWPAEWTHVHAGQVVKSGTKYIITGWMHIPHPAA